MGAKCADLCRKYGMSEETFYNWKAKYDGFGREVPEGLGGEKPRLKKFLAKQMLDGEVEK